VAEFHATLVHGMILAVRGENSEAARLLEQADDLLGVSGAAFFEPQLSRLRSHLER
jgi:hypothetical protein